MTQKLIQVLQTRNSTSEFFENLYRASSNTISGPVTPRILLMITSKYLLVNLILRVKNNVPSQHQ
jgi:hypothetical protein